ncbi:DUF4920 domain-containing protein [Formosa sp. L2A11]|uniref:DUF4920 domain-containing protein n=1 Tax=Formosa sp. L2A11 TaxID=2686363 RepID=UPI00131D5A34|nr:DUF4920 domain-containing protein [Formosa sp. L2A11]
MKKIILLLAISLTIFSCKNETKPVEISVEDTTTEIAYSSFGKEINDTDVLTSEDMMKHYKDLKIGDTINSKLKGKIIEVCPKKGCWMTLDVDGGEKPVMVKFKDYAFFMPLKAKGDVVVNGIAFVTETPVEELRHYAEDAGKSAEEIAAITAPKLEYRFEADGVLLRE